MDRPCSAMAADKVTFKAKQICIIATVILNLKAEVDSYLL